MTLNQFDARARISPQCVEAQRSSLTVALRRCPYDWATLEENEWWQMRDLRSGRRARLWLVLGLIGVIAILCSPLASAVAKYFHATLSDRDQLSSVYGLWVGIASLVVAVM